MTLVHNRAVDAVRRESAVPRPRLADGDCYMGPDPAGESVQDEVIARSEADALRSRLGQLPDAQLGVQCVAQRSAARLAAPERETVLLLNASASPVDLTGWRIADRSADTCPVPAGPLAPGATLAVVMSGEVPLGNQGGTITLLDATGLKVSGVSYTAAQVRREGWTIVF